MALLIHWNYYETGKRDCENTFDQDDFEVDRIVEYGIVTERQAEKHAKAALRNPKHFMEIEDWATAISFHSSETALTRQEAYNAWRQGYVACAMPKLVEAIMREAAFG
jgi:hypothetical protein